MQPSTAFLTLAPTLFHPGKARIRNTPRTPRCTLDPHQLVLKQLVYLGSQRVGDSGAAAVAAALRHPASQIRHVNLDSCDLTCQGAIELASGLEGNTVLEELVLYDNQIADDGASALASALAKQPSALRVLSLPHNRIGPRGGAALGAMLATNHALRTVYLMGQSSKGAGIHDEGARAWAEGIANNRGSFWFANLNGNGITEEGLTSLRNARTEGKHVIFPVDPYPGSNPTQSNVGGRA